MATEPPRERTAETRMGVTQKVSNACGFELYVTVNFYPDGDLKLDLHGGEPSEVYLTIAKKGSIVGGFTRVFAVLISVMLQYHIPWEVIYGKLNKMKFDPHNDEYTSLVDVIAQSINEIVKGAQE